MPDWIPIAGGWMLGCLGVIGLWRGVALVRGEGRDSLGVPAPVVLVESAGMLLLGAALLFGEAWVFLVIPGAVLVAAGELDRIRHRRLR
jgi:hypothetical protein